MDFRVQYELEDLPYGWEVAWDGGQHEEGYYINLGLDLRFDHQIPLAARQDFQDKCQAAVRKYFDGRFELVGADSSRAALRIRIDWQHTHPHRVIPVSPGFIYGDLDHWYLDWELIDLAHELGHALGLVDEYRDPESTFRQHLSVAGVWQDHSLMGDYRQEGPVYAALRLRHGEVWARTFAEHFRQEFSVQFAKNYRTIAGDTLGQIAARLYGDDRKRYDLQQLNAGQLTADDLLSEGLILKLL